MSKSHPRYYRVRLVFGAWYVFVWERGVIIEERGPFTYIEANADAAATGYLNLDQHLEAVEQLAHKQRKHEEE